MPALALKTLGNDQNYDKGMVMMRDKCMTWDSMRTYDLLMTGQHVLPFATTVSRYCTIDILLFQLQSTISYPKRNTYKT